MARNHHETLHLNREWRPVTTTRSVGEQAVRATRVADGDVDSRYESSVAPRLSQEERRQMIDEIFGSPQHETQSRLNVRYRTFEEAKAGQRDWSNFIDDSLEKMEQNKFFSSKLYFDNVAPTPNDREIIGNYERVGELYEKTADVVARNFAVFVHPHVPDHIRTEAVALKQGFPAYIRSHGKEIGGLFERWKTNVKNGIKNPSEDARRINHIVNYESPYRVDSKDIIDAATALPQGVRTNMRIQRQVFGQFVMGYSNRSVKERIYRTGAPVTKRIYLNPEMEAAPEVFEEILQYANANDVALQLKTIQRATELGNRDDKDDDVTLRGDGIVVYVNDTNANEVLANVLKIAENHADAFIGRRTSRIPQRVADGVSVGEEPNVSGESLTSHRATLIDSIMTHLRIAKVSGPAAAQLFEQKLRQKCLQEGVDPNNIAFNA